MPIVPLRIGVPQVFLAVPSSTAVPSVGSLVFSVSDVAPAAAGDFLINDVKTPLSTGTNYQFRIALLGRDVVNKGYTFNIASPASGIIQLAQAGDGFQIRVASGAWPANFDLAICACIFMKKGSSSVWTLAELAYIDPTADFEHVVLCDPFPGAPTFTAAQLDAATADAVGGSRAPKGVTYPASVGTTTEGVTVERDVNTVKVSPDDAPDYEITTSRAANVKFKTLPNAMKQITGAAAGNYAKFVGTDGITREIAQQVLLTASAVLPGNAAMKLLMPPDSTGFSETRLYLGQLTINQTKISENWKKTATTPVEFVLQTAPQDALIKSQHSEIIYKKNG